MATIRDRARKIIEESLSVDKEQVVPDASIQDDLGADSLDVVELVMALEEEFKIEVPDEDKEQLGTVELICAYIEEKLASKA